MAIIDYPNGQAISGMTGSLKSVPSVWVPLSDLDKHVCFSPDDWKAIADYIHTLEYDAGYLK